MTTTSFKDFNELKTAISKFSNYPGYFEKPELRDAIKAFVTNASELRQLVGVIGLTSLFAFFDNQLETLFTLFQKDPTIINIEMDHEQELIFYKSKFFEKLVLETSSSKELLNKVLLFLNSKSISYDKHASFNELVDKHRKAILFNHIISLGTINQLIAEHWKDLDDATFEKIFELLSEKNKETLLTLFPAKRERYLKLQLPQLQLSFVVKNSRVDLLTTTECFNLLNNDSLPRLERGKLALLMLKTIHDQNIIRTHADKIINALTMMDPIEKDIYLTNHSVTWLPLLKPLHQEVHAAYQKMLFWENKNASIPLWQVLLNITISLLSCPPSVLFFLMPYFTAGPAGMPIAVAVLMGICIGLLITCLAFHVQSVLYDKRIEQLEETYGKKHFVEILLNDLNKINELEKEAPTLKTWLSTPISFGRLFSKKPSASDQQDLSDMQLLPPPC